MLIKFYITMMCKEYCSKPVLISFNLFIIYFYFISRDLREHHRGEYFSHEPVMVTSLASYFSSNIRPHCENKSPRTSLFPVNREKKLSRIKVVIQSQLLTLVYMVASNQGPAVFLILLSDLILILCNVFQLLKTLPVT